MHGLDWGHYQRLPVTTVECGGGGERVSKAEAYFAHIGFGERLWKRCGQEGLIEFSVEMGKKYVRREDRPPHSTFLEDISKFISDCDSSSLV
ncbi:AIG2-like (avirulence induced gene) family protein [Striga hermonthica]|uniref:AIG2-like (Avirulence induced gene) family protein n=1 Tax=Striga hermonthica TaxID=68872 RepID=A0A9N7NHY8_STRHE|nr:AIG2-like (avirulence induced gene) family protein [Striga hermonthica]